MMSQPFLAESCSDVATLSSLELPVMLQPFDAATLSSLELPVMLQPFLA